MNIGDMVHYVDEFAEKIDVQDNNNVLDSQESGVHNFAFITRVHNEDIVDLEVHRPFEIIHRKTVKRSETDKPVNTWHEVENV